MDEESGDMKAAVWLPEKKPAWILSPVTVLCFFLVLLFTIMVFYSQGVDTISTFTSTTFQKTFSVMQKAPSYTFKPESYIMCNSTSTSMVATCPSNYPPQYWPPTQQPNTSTQPECPEYFRWIHEDLKPWKTRGITREMLHEIERIGSFRHFRLTIVNGTAYVKRYKKSFQTRDVFTLWGVLQLLRRYPGKLPDLDLMFQSNDKTSIMKDAFEEDKAPPLFHYCGSDHSYDIAFPDWSFWGWPEINIKPWVSLMKDFEKGNKLKKWMDREPYAFFKSNLFTGDRKNLRNCNSTKDWKALIYEQDWGTETREGFKKSDMSKQCTHRYKIYMEGNAWSVSRKYILACDSMTLLVDPIYYEFFSRGMVPMKHYWPIQPNKLCKSIKSAIDWGNMNPAKAQEIGKEGSNFIRDKITMNNVYDYMFHLLSEYGRLMTYKPTVPPGAVELCSEFWVCAQDDLELAFKVETSEMAPKPDNPCTLPPPFSKSEIDGFKEQTGQGFIQAQMWSSQNETVTKEALEEVKI